MSAYVPRKFRDDKAYTEDNVLIYNVCTRNISSDITEEIALKYFSTFGEVLKFYLQPNNEPNRTAHAFIHFASATAAAQTLKMPYHTLDDKSFSVFACASWLQPRNATDDLAIAKAAAENVNDENPLLQLNDDCLVQIFMWLKLNEQVRFALVCRRTRLVFEMCSKVLCKKIDTIKLLALTIWQIRDFFTIAGSNIKTLDVNLVRNNNSFDYYVSKFIAKYCLSLTRLIVHNQRIAFHKWFPQLHSIQYLKFNNCEIIDNDILNISKLPHLQVLNLSDNYEDEGKCISGKYFDKLANLEELTLERCKLLQRDCFLEFCISTKKLQKLDLSRCRSMRSNQHLPNRFLQHCSNLKVLIICCKMIQNCEGLLHLPHLRQLELYDLNKSTKLETFLSNFLKQENHLECLKITSINEQLFRSITLQEAALIAGLTQLKVLCICENITNCHLRQFEELEHLEYFSVRCKFVNAKFTNAGLLRLLRKCRKLSYIDVGVCPTISDDFVFEAIKLLQLSSVHYKEPIQFFVGKTSIDQLILNTLQYIEAMSLLKLSFDLPDGKELKGEYALFLGVNKIQ